MSNWSQAEKALQTSMNATGSAAKENAAYIDSIAGRTAQLKASFEDFSNTVINSELIKNGVSFLNDTIKLLDGIIEKFGLLTIAAPIAVKALSAKLNTPNFAEIYDMTWGKKSNGNAIAQVAGKELTENLAKTVGDNITDGLENVGKNVTPKAKSIGSSIGKSIVGGLTVTAIAALVTLGAYIIQEWSNIIPKLKKEVETLADEYKSTTSELEEINNKLKENADKINEINANPLDFTDDSTLQDLKDQNTELSTQKQVLEDIARLKKEQLEDKTKELLSKQTYSSETERDKTLSVIWGNLKNGELEEALSNASVFGFKVNEEDNGFVKGLKNAGNALAVFGGGLFTFLSDMKRLGKTNKNVTAEEYANESVTTFNDLLTKRDTLLTSGEFDVFQYIEINKQLDETKTKLLQTIEYLNEQKSNLSETSDEYKNINKLIEEQQEALKKYDETNQGSIVEQYIDNFASSANFDEKKLEEVRKKYVDKTHFEITWGQTYTEYANRSTNIRDILKENNIKTSNDGATRITAKNYNDILNALEQINALKQQGLYEDNQANNILVERLQKMAEITDEEKRYLDFIQQTEAYSFVQQYNFDNGKSFNEIGANNYKSYVDGVITAAQEAGYNTTAIESILASIFPNYQNSTDLIKSYITENGGFKDLIEASYSGMLSGDKITENTELANWLDENGYKAEQAALAFRLLAEEENKAAVSAVKLKASQLQGDFNTNKQGFDDNNAATKSTFASAISSVNQGNNISYEDTWKLIEADSSLASEFVKTVDGYTIAVDKLESARDRYITSSADVFKQNIIDTEQAIAEAKTKKEQAYKILNSTNDISKIIDASKTISDSTSAINTLNAVLEENKLMYQEALDPAYSFVNAVDELSSKFSSLQSILENVNKDISSIGKLSADTVVSIISSFPNNWEQMLTLDNGNITFNKDKQDDIIKNVIGYDNKENDIKDTVTSNKKERASASAELDRLANKYLAVNTAGEALEDRIKKLRTAMNNSSEATEEDKNKLTELEHTFETTGKNIEEAGEKLEWLKVLFDALAESFRELQSVATFNASVEGFDHTLAMGGSNDDYLESYRNALYAFRDDAIEKGEWENPEAQRTFEQGLEKLHSLEQSSYEKNYSKQQQFLEDSYNQKLITAEEYYEQLNDIEDTYYNSIDDPDGTNQATKARNRLERRQQLNSDETARIQKLYEQGQISYSQMSQQIFDSIEKWLGGEEKLADAFNTASAEANQYVYEAIKAELEKSYSKGEISFSDFEKQLNSAAETYLSGCNELTKYYTEEIQNNLSSMYNNFLTEQDRYYERGYLSAEEYAKACYKAYDKYYIQPSVQKFEEATTKINSQFSSGNVKLSERITANKGQPLETSSAVIKNGDKYTSVLFTPVLPDGTVLSSDEVANYLYNTLANANDILETDKENFNIVIDTKLADISEADIRSMNDSIPTDAMQKILDTNDKWCDSVNEAEKAFKEIEESTENIALKSQETYEAWKKMYEAAKGTVQSNINGIQYVIDKNKELADGRKEALQEANDDIKEQYDKQIKALEKQKDSLEESLEKEKLKNLKNQRTRAVLQADGTLVYKQDEEKIKEAEKSLIDAQIDKLQEERDNKTEQNDKKINDIDKALKIANKPLEVILKALGANISENFKVDMNFLNKFLNTDAGKQGIAQYNQAYGTNYTAESLFNYLKNAGIENFVDSTQTDQKTKEQQIVEAVKDDIKNDEAKTLEINNGGVTQVYTVVTTHLPSIATNIQTLLDTITGTNKSSANISPIALFDYITSVQPITVGDIYINNPVGNAYDLAQELITNLPNAINRQTHKS